MLAGGVDVPDGGVPVVVIFGLFSWYLLFFYLLDLCEFVLLRLVGSQGFGRRTYFSYVRGVLTRRTAVVVPSALTGV